MPVSATSRRFSSRGSAAEAISAAATPGRSFFLAVFGQALPAKGFEVGARYRNLHPFGWRCDARVSPASVDHDDAGAAAPLGPVGTVAGAWDDNPDTAGHLEQIFVHLPDAYGLAVDGEVHADSLIYSGQRPRLCFPFACFASFAVRKRGFLLCRHVLLNPRSRSAVRSSNASSPTERRTRPSVMPRARRSGRGMAACDMVAG